MFVYSKINVFVDGEFETITKNSDVSEQVFFIF